MQGPPALPCLGTTWDHLPPESLSQELPGGGQWRRGRAERAGESRWGAAGSGQGRGCRWGKWEGVSSGRKIVQKEGLKIDTVAKQSLDRDTSKQHCQRVALGFPLRNTRNQPKPKQRKRQGPAWHSQLRILPLGLSPALPGQAWLGCEPCPVPAPSCFPLRLRVPACWPRAPAALGSAAHVAEGGTQPLLRALTRRRPASQHPAQSRRDGRRALDDSTEMSHFHSALRGRAGRAQCP